MIGKSREDYSRRVGNFSREAASTRSHETKTTLRFVAIKLRNEGSEHDQMRAPRASSRSRQNRWMKKEEREELNETREELLPGKKDSINRYW